MTHIIGFWRMKQTQDPWTIRKDKKSSKLHKRQSEGGDSSPKRCKTDDGSDGMPSLSCYQSLCDHLCSTLNEWTLSSGTPLILNPGRHLARTFPAKLWWEAMVSSPCRPNGMNPLCMSASMYPLLFNFPVASPNAILDDSATLRLNPLASI